MGYEQLQMQVFVENLSDRIAENSNPIQESESGRENANESTASEGERKFTNQDSQPTGEQNKTMEEYNG